MKLLPRFCRFLVFPLMCVTLLALPAMAVIEFEIEGVTVQSQGETANVYVLVKNLTANEDILSIQFKLLYDPAKLSVITRQENGATVPDIAKTDATDQWYIERNEASAGELRIALAHAQPEDDLPEGNSQVVRIPFDTSNLPVDTCSDLQLVTLDGKLINEDSSGMAEIVGPSATLDDSDGESDDVCLTPASVIFSLLPSTSTVGGGSQLTLTIHVDNPNGEAIQSTGVYLTYDCNRLTITNPAEPFQAGPLLPVNLGFGDLDNDTHDDVDNADTNGIADCQLDFVRASTLNSVNTSGDVATLEFDVKPLLSGEDSATTMVSFDFDEPNVRRTEYTIEGVGGALVPGAIDAEIIIPSTDGIPVRVPLEGRTNHSAHVDFDISDGTSVVESFTCILTDSDGRVTLQTQLPPGTYDIFAKEFHCLRDCVQSVTLPVPVGTEVEFNELITGECDNSSGISLNDFSFLAKHLGQPTTRPTCPYPSTNDEFNDLC